MSLALARFLYRVPRRPHRPASSPAPWRWRRGAQITRIDNDISAWFSKDDPVLRDYDRLRQEFTGSRTLIVALEGPGVTSAAGLDVLRRITADVERVPYVVRAYSLASANTIRSTGGGDDAGIEVRPLIPRAGRHRRRNGREDGARRSVPARRPDRPRRLGGVAGRSTSTRIASTPSAPGPSSGSAPSSIATCRRTCAPTTTAASRSARPTTGSRSPTPSSSRRRSC